jgi:adenylate cyclase
MAKILGADDEADLEVLIKQKFRRQIRDNKYSFVFALNGNDALAKMQEHPDVEIVLSDINMPELDGLSLLQKLNETNPLTKTVMVSAYGDMDNIRSAMNKGAFDFVCKPVNFEDLELTIEKAMKQVAQIRQTLQAIKENNILKMYVDEAVLNFMNHREFEKSLLENETVEVTVVFIDICSFTVLTENEPADKVVNLLNQYFDVMAKEILAQGGYVDKFIGDAVMAVFRGQFHLDRAVDAALGIRKSINSLPVNAGAIEFKPKVSIGINTGEVISGNIGSATLKRLDFTVIGDVVNTAQRLQSVAKEGQILLNEACYEKIKESFNCRKVGEETLKNKSGKTVVYEVID